MGRRRTRGWVGVDNTTVVQQCVTHVPCLMLAYQVYSSHRVFIRVCCPSLMPSTLTLRNLLEVSCSGTFEKHLFFSRPSACPTQCCTSQVGNIERSKQHKSQGVFFARKRLATQACIGTSNRTSNRWGCNVCIRVLFRLYIPPFSVGYPRFFHILPSPICHTCNS